MGINTTIEELNLSDNKFSDDEPVITAISEAIMTTTTNLMMIDLKFNDIKEAGVQKLMEAIKLQKKTKIDVTDRFSKTTSDSLIALMKEIKTKKPKKKGGMASKKKK